MKPVTWSWSLPKSYLKRLIHLIKVRSSLNLQVFPVCISHLRMKHLVYIHPLKFNFSSARPFKQIRKYCKSSNQWKIICLPCELAWSCRPSARPSWSLTGSSTWRPPPCSLAPWDCACRCSGLPAPACRWAPSCQTGRRTEPFQEEIRYVLQHV